MKSPAPAHDSTGHDKESQASEDRDCAGPSEKSCGRLSKSSEYVTCVCIVSNHGHFLLTGGEKLEDVPTKVQNDGTKKLSEDEEECDNENNKPAVAESEATREKVPKEGKKPEEAVRTEVAKPESEKDDRKEEEQEPISAHKK